MKWDEHDPLYDDMNLPENKEIKTSVKKVKRGKTKKEKIIKREYRKSSNLSGCVNCDWTGEGRWEAREHCRKTGHKTWNEYNIVCYFEKDEK